MKSNELTCADNVADTWVSSVSMVGLTRHRRPSARVSRVGLWPVSVSRSSVLSSRLVAVELESAEAAITTSSRCPPHGHREHSLKQVSSLKNINI